MFGFERDHMHARNTSWENVAGQRRGGTRQGWGKIERGSWREEGGRGWGRELGGREGGEAWRGKGDGVGERRGGGREGGRESCQPLRKAQSWQAHTSGLVGHVGERVRR